MWIDSDEVEEAFDLLTELMDAGKFPKSDVISAIPTPEADLHTQAAREANQILTQFEAWIAENTNDHFFTAVLIPRDILESIKCYREDWIE